MYFSDNKIFVFTNNDLFYILDDQAKILETIRTTDHMFLETNGVLYMESGNSIKAVDIASNNELWHVQLDNIINHAPIFNKGTIVFDTAASPPTIYSINQSTGDVIWKDSSRYIE